MSAIETADTYGIVVPVEWTEVPLDQEEYATFCRQVLEQLRAADGWNKTAERRADLLFAQIRNDLIQGRTRLAAVFAESSTDDEGALELLVAGMSISRLTAGELSPAGLPIEVGQLLAALSADRDQDEKDRVVDVSPPARIELNGRPTVVLRRLHEQRVAPAEVLRYYAQTYLVPHDEGQLMCVLQFATPNVEDASLIDELFQAIAETLRIFYPGDPTDFEGPAAEVDGGS